MDEPVPNRSRTGGASYRVKLNEKPCAVRYVKLFGGFIVGTYDCLSDIGSARERFPGVSEEEVVRIYTDTNHRIGSLNFLCPISQEDANPVYQLQVALRCKHGGIFDMSVADSHIYAAHANGYVARYSFDDVKFTSLESIKVTESNNTLLTSIDTYNMKEPAHGFSFLSIVGDSQGRATLVSGRQLEKVIASCDITTNADPLWQVKFLPNQSGTGELIVLVAAEDSCWYVYRVKIGREASTFKRIYRNQDFQSGVTSICFPAPSHELEFSFNVLLGSYDETIRLYKLKLDASRDGVQVDSQLHPPIVLRGGGIWRLNLTEDNTILIAAMYAGSYRISAGFLCDEARPDRIECDKIIGLELQDGHHEAPLHYGIDLSPQDSLVCIVDYNNNYCIFTKQAQSS